MYEVPFPVALTAMRGAELSRKFPAHLVKSAAMADKLLKGEITDSDVAAIRKVVDEGPGCEGYRPEKPPEQLIKYMCHGGNQARKWLDDIGDSSDPFAIEVKVEKVDAELGIVFGYAIVCTQKDDRYFDLHDDHIPESAMLNATAKYMSGSRIAKDMHKGDPCGQVVYGFPMTVDIAKSLNITIERSGFIVGMRPDSAEMLAKFRSGEYTGFSIGGRRVQDSEIN